MGLLIKFLIFFGIIYFGYRIITRPFREYIKQAKRQAEMNRRPNQEPKSKENESKTKDIGEYIDYEEVE